jgi:hypothetical protein
LQKAPCDPIPPHHLQTSETTTLEVKDDTKLTAIRKQTFVLLKDETGAFYIYCKQAFFRRMKEEEVKIVC